ncbi:RNA chaperone Hfq, partial [Microvirga sp. 3-52]|nr:RNA chaperone Hfq [Microvirga sp. 3-52]
MKQGKMQDVFLNSLRKSNISVTVFLMNGFQLKGLIKSYDNYTVLLETDGK